MWIVRIALQRPYTFLVMALTIVLATPYMLLTMPTDILPDINIPVISIIWNYSGLVAAGHGRSHHRAERAHPDHHGQRHRTYRVAVPTRRRGGQDLPPAAAPISARRIAQTVASEQVMIKMHAAGHDVAARASLIRPPSIPVVQLALSSPTLPEQAVNRRGDEQSFGRSWSPFPASPFPAAYGGKQRIVSVDIDTAALLAKGLSPLDVVNAVNAQNLILPSGTAKMGPTEFTVGMNGSPDSDRGPQRSAGAHLQWRGDLSARSRPCARRLLAADQYRAPRRRARRAAVAAQDRQRPRPCASSRTLKDMLPQAEKLLPAGHRRARAVRPVDLRPRRHLRRVPRGPDRGRPDRRADPALSRQLARDADHRGLDPAVDPVLVAGSATSSARPSTS